MRRPSRRFSLALMVPLLGTILLLVAPVVWSQNATDPQADQDTAAAKTTTQEAHDAAQDARHQAEQAQAVAMEAKALVADAHNSVNQSRLQLARISADYEASHTADQAVLLAILAAGSVAFGLAAFRLTH